LNTLKMPLPNKPRVVLPLVVIVGPTAVGKTEVAIRVAEKCNGEIISADSRLFYRGMDIGTAKPTLEERQRVPHHLIDVSEPDETWSLTRFQSEAKRWIDDILARGRLPFLVGGTGQYIKAVTEDWQPSAQQPDPQLRTVLEKWAGELGADELHARLAVLDPDAAGFIDAANVRRNIRALEVILSSGRRFSEQRSKGESPYQVLMIGLKRPRAELYARVDARIEAMFAAGFIDEVSGLLAKGYSAQLPTLSAIGYREAVAILQGQMTQEEAVVQMKRLTRRYVRQQGNWFPETDNQIHWFEMDEHTPDLILALLAENGLGG
jgi:tRNA dimethylallyltransferase